MMKCGANALHVLTSYQ